VERAVDVGGDHLVVGVEHHPSAVGLRSIDHERPPAILKTSLSIQSRMGLKVTSPGGQNALRILVMISSGLS